MTTIEKVCAAFPELDMVNHMNRVKLVSEEKCFNREFSMAFFCRVK